MGHVPAHDGDYVDAHAKGHPVHLLVTEPTGALSDHLVDTLRGLAAQARAAGAIDHTAYGVERGSTKDFAAHHMAAISTAVAANVASPYSTF